MILRSALLLLITVTLSACSVTPVVNTDHDANVDFSGYKSFFISPLTVENSPLIAALNPLMLQRIEKSMQDALESKGLEIAEKGDADLAIEYLITVKDVTDVHDAGFIHRGRYFSDIHVRHYQKGTLIINIFDNTSKEAIWHGSGSRRLNHKAASEEEVDRAISAILKQFPPS